MSQQKQAIFIADLGFGDAGKGTITDFLTRQHTAHTIVRYNGGPQAAHNVVTSEGQHHTFSQFGSGMFLPWTKTLLSRFMFINPLNMLNEERHLSAVGVTNALQRTQIDRRALVISPFQKATNRLQEIARGEGRHGSCGEGIGACMNDHLKHGNLVLCAGDLQDQAIIRQKLAFLRDIKRAEIDKFSHLLPETEAVNRELAIFTDNRCIEDCIDVYHYFSDCVDIIDEDTIRSIFEREGTVLFEGAQGVLLDENFAFAPYSTWSTTTFGNADTLVQEHNYTGEIVRLGIVRAYATRHGAGPFPTEDATLTTTLPEAHNSWNDWQQTFRVGHFDLVATNYAQEVVDKLDCLAVTHLDRLEAMPIWKLCTAYHYQGEQKDLSNYFEQKDSALTKIKVCQPPNLIHQEKLTNKLRACMPAYQTLTPRSGQRFSREERDAYLSLLAEKLALPIAIASYGTTAADKQYFSY
jgi:adenylosuccinate synthase